MVIAVNEHEPHTTEAPTLEQAIRRLARRTGLTTRQAESTYLANWWTDGDDWFSGTVNRRVRGHGVYCYRITWRYDDEDRDHHFATLSDKTHGGHR
jgi:hypothetical protein